MTSKPDLHVIKRLIGELLLIDKAIEQLDSNFNKPSAAIVVHYIDGTNTGRDLRLPIEVETARDILGIQRAAKTLALKLAGLDVL